MNIILITVSIILIMVLICFIIYLFKGILLLKNDIKGGFKKSYTKSLKHNNKFSFDLEKKTPWVIVFCDRVTDSIFNSILNNILVVCGPIDIETNDDNSNIFAFNGYDTDFFEQCKEKKNNLLLKNTLCVIMDNGDSNNHCCQPDKISYIKENLLIPDGKIYVPLNLFDTLCYEYYDSRTLNLLNNSFVPKGMVGIDNYFNFIYDPKQTNNSMKWIIGLNYITYKYSYEKYSKKNKKWYLESELPEEAKNWGIDKTFINPFNHDKDKLFILTNVFAVHYPMRRASEWLLSSDFRYLYNLISDVFFNYNEDRINKLKQILTELKCEEMFEEMEKLLDYDKLDSNFGIFDFVEKYLDDALAEISDKQHRLIRCENIIKRIFYDEFSEIKDDEKVKRFKNILNKIGLNDNEIDDLIKLCYGFEGLDIMVTSNKNNSEIPDKATSFRSVMNLIGFN